MSYVNPNNQIRMSGSGNVGIGRNMLVTDGTVSYKIDKTPEESIDPNNVKINEPADNGLNSNDNSAIKLR